MMEKREEKVKKSKRTWMHRKLVRGVEDLRVLVRVIYRKRKKIRWVLFYGGKRIGIFQLE